MGVLASLAGAQTLTTTFAGGQSVAGNTFTLSAQRPITLVGFDLNIAAVGSTNAIACYYRPAGIGGQETNPAAWLSLGTDSGVLSSGAGLASRARFAGVELAPGSSPGFYLDVASSSAGSGNILGATPGTTPFANADLTLTPNSAQGSPAFSSSTPGVMWNGRVAYKPTASCVPESTTYFGLLSSRGVTFDVKASDALTITGFDVNLDNLGSRQTIAVYQRPGTAVGFESTPGAWTLLGIDPNVVSAGLNQPTRVRVGGLELAPGQNVGIYIDLASFTGTTFLQTTPGGGTYGAHGLQIVGGTGQGSPAFSSVFAGRLWNGAVLVAPGASVRCLDASLASDGGASGTMFDLTPARDIEFDGVDVVLASAGAGNVVTLRYRVGSSVGFESTSAGWSVAGTDVAVVSPGAGNAAPVRVRGLRLVGGQTYGLYVSVESGGTMRSLAGPRTLSNADLLLSSNCDKAAPAFSGTTTPGRAFVGRVYYHPLSCYANCDGSTGTPALSAADFVCFLAKFRAGESGANCDGSTGSPTLSAADFVCFLAAFRAGCP